MAKKKVGIQALTSEQALPVDRVKNTYISIYREVSRSDKSECNEVRSMNLQQLKYVLAVAEAKSITKAAGELYISQPSLSNAIKDLETKTGITLFVRSRSGVTLTKEGMEFLGYARQVIQQMELLEDKYIMAHPPKTRFGVSTQHYTFTENAFVELIQRF